MGSHCKALGLLLKLQALLEKHIAENIQQCWAMGGTVTEEENTIMCSFSNLPVKVSDYMFAVMLATGGFLIRTKLSPGPITDKWLYSKKLCVGLLVVFFLLISVKFSPNDCMK